MSKDYFSAVSEDYSKFRPNYPTELYDCIFKEVVCFENAWDCATGNGQVAAVLADSFKNVEATDISQQQLENAKQKENIHYSIGLAESAKFDNNCFDLITVGQAAHWFDMTQFNVAANSLLKPQGIVALFGYQLFQTEHSIQTIVNELYNDILGNYWHPERKLVDNQLRDLEFPYEEIECPAFHHNVRWNLDNIIGYISTWSALQNYLKTTGKNPMQEFVEKCRQVLSEAEFIPVTIPFFLRLGKKIQ